MNTSIPGKPATFDPARFRVEKQQHFQTPGHFTVFFDGKMVGSYKAKTWIEPYTYRPAIYRERMTASPEEWIMREAKHACTDRFGQIIRATDIDTMHANQAPRARG